MTTIFVIPAAVAGAVIANATACRTPAAAIRNDLTPGPVWTAWSRRRSIPSFAPLRDRAGYTGPRAVYNSYKCSIRQNRRCDFITFSFPPFLPHESPKIRYP